MILQEIDKKILGLTDFGFNIDVINVLNDSDASQKEIESVKSKISPQILLKVIDIANSSYFGTLKSKEVCTFYDAVMTLGMKNTQILIIYFALFALAKNKEVELILAKSFARYVLGGFIYSGDLGLTKTAVHKVELGCLLMDIGKILILLFKIKHEDDYRRLGIDETFIENFHMKIGCKACEKFNIPEELKDMIFQNHFVLGTNHIALAGILKTVYALTESVFKENEDKFVLYSPMPDNRGRVTHSKGVVIRDLFNAVGLSEYLIIIDVPSGTLRSSPERIERKSNDQKDIDCR